MRGFVSELAYLGRTIGYGCDHEIVRGLETHPKVVPRTNYIWILCGRGLTSVVERHMRSAFN